MPCCVCTVQGSAGEGSAMVHWTGQQTSPLCPKTLLVVDCYTLSTHCYLVPEGDWPLALIVLMVGQRAPGSVGGPGPETLKESRPGYQATASQGSQRRRAETPVGSVGRLWFFASRPPAGCVRRQLGPSATKRAPAFKAGSPTALGCATAQGQRRPLLLNFECSNRLTRSPGPVC